MLKPLCRVESGINKPAKYQESLFKKVIFLEVISFDVEMQLPALKGQLSPANGLRGIPLLRICWERLWEKIPSRKFFVAVLGKNTNARSLRICIRKLISLRNREYFETIVPTLHESNEDRGISLHCRSNFN